MPSDAPSSTHTTAPRLRAPITLIVVALVIVPVNFAVWWFAADNRADNALLLVVFRVLAVTQFGAAAGALITSAYGLRKRPAGGSTVILTGIAALGVLAAVGAVLGGVVGLVAMKIP